MVEINDVNRKKITSRSKLKAVSKNNDFTNGKDISRICLETLLKLPIEKSTNSLRKNLTVLKRKAEKQLASTKCLIKYRGQKLDNSFDYVTVCINKTKTKKLMKSSILPLPWKVTSELLRTTEAAAMLLNRIWFEEILRKNQNGFQRNRSTTSNSDSPSNHRMSARKKSWVNTIVRRFLPAIRFHTQRKAGLNTSSI